MGGGEASPAKVCIVCKQDCSARPRQKDEQGRYTCQSCVDKLAKAKGQPKPGAPAKTGAAPNPTPGAKQPQTDAALTIALTGVDQTSMIACPNCAVLLKPGSVLCTACGYDLEKARPLRTRVTVEKATKESRGDFSLPISWDIVAGIMMTLIVAAGGFAFFSPAGVVPFWIALSINTLIVGLMLIVIPFQDKQNAWGAFNLGAPLLAIAMIVGGGSGAVPCVGAILFLITPWVMMYYVFAVNWRASLKRLFLAGFVGGLVLGGLISAHGPDKILGSIGLDLNEDQKGKGAPPHTGKVPEGSTSEDGGP